MYIKQLSVFIENREGRLDDVLAVLKNSGVNIVSLSLADTSDYGLLRLIVSDPVKGREALKTEGFSAMLTDVVVIKLEHQAGKLQELLAHICKSSINIEYMYALATSGDDASIVIKTTDLEKAAAVLSAKGIALATAAEVEG